MRIFLKKITRLALCSTLFGTALLPAYAIEYSFRATVQKPANAPVSTYANSGDQIIGSFFYSANPSVNYLFTPTPATGHATVYSTDLQVAFRDLQTGLSYDSRTSAGFTTLNRPMIYVENDVVPTAQNSRADSLGQAIGADTVNFLFGKQNHDFYEGGSLSFDDLAGKALDIYGAINASLPPSLTLADFTNSSFNYSLSDQFKNQFISLDARIDSLTLTSNVAAPIPEPETYLMLLSGLSLLIFSRYKKFSFNRNLKSMP